MYSLEMPMSFQQAMDIVDGFDTEDLQALTRGQIAYIIGGLTEEQASEIMFTMSVKQLGGINGYAENFLSSGNVMRIKSMPGGEDKRNFVQAALNILNKMLTYDELTEANRAGITLAILQLTVETSAMPTLQITNETAPAAGGYKRKNGKGRKSRKGRKNKTTKKSNVLLLLL